MSASLGMIKKLRGLPEGVALYLCPFVCEGERAQLKAQREVTLRLIQHALELPSPPVLEHRPNGAPYLPAYPDLSISVSHAEGLASILLAPSPWAVGVDLCIRGAHGIDTPLVCQGSPLQDATATLPVAPRLSANGCPARGGTSRDTAL